jgi:excinuclease ABC subunit C
VGPVRRAALIAHFGSVKVLQQASAAEIAQVEGIPQSLAERIAAFFADRKQTTPP